MGKRKERKERKGNLKFSSQIQIFVLTFIQSRACPFLLMYDHIHSNRLRSLCWFGGLNSLGLGVELSESRAPTSGISFPWFSASVQLQ